MLAVNLRIDISQNSSGAMRAGVGRPTDGVRKLGQDRGLDRGCFAVCWGIGRVETAGGCWAPRGGGAHWIGLLSGFGVGRQF